MDSNDCWMVRAGGGNRLIELFAEGRVLIGWAELGDLIGYADKDALKRRYAELYPDQLDAKIANAVAMLWKFSREIRQGDKIVTYDKSRREYLYGHVTSAYRFRPALNEEHPHERSVNWTKKISRDALKPSSRNSLGSTLALFWVNEDVQKDLASSPDVSESPSIPSDVAERVEKEELDLIKDETKEKSVELIKDRIAALSDRDLPELVAAVLRAMGFKTKVSPPGSDRRVDVLASPDGLGLMEPRIKVEVKHRKHTQMGSQDLRKFIGGLRGGDRGLYVSSGGFSKEARYEADRAQFPFTLIDLDDLTKLLIENYDRFDAEGRALINLVRVYWPA